MDERTNIYNEQTGANNTTGDHWSRPVEIGNNARPVSGQPQEPIAFPNQPISRPVGSLPESWQGAGWSAYSTTPIGLDSTPNAHSTPNTPNNTPNSTPNVPGAVYAGPGYNAPHSVPNEATRQSRHAANPKKSKGGGGGRFVAAMLAVSLLSGTAGGGATYLLMNRTEANLAGGGVSSAYVDDAVPATTDASSASTGGTPITNISSVSPVTAVVDKVSDSVVEISTTAQGNNFFYGAYTTGSSGSGVIVSDDGYIVTNDHVIDGAETIAVRTSDGTEYEAVLIGTDDKTDLAVLKIDATGLKPVSYADSEQIQVGQLAVAIGNPLGTLGGTVTEGIISAKDREITVGQETMTLLQTSAAVNPGNSGGGLFDENGNLVGIINLKSAGEEIEGLGFAIPSNTVREVVEDILENGYVTGRPQLGVQLVDIQDTQTAMYYRVNEFGVYVARVDREISLQVGDRLISVNGTEIESAQDVKDAVTAGEIGEELSFVVDRDGKRVPVSVELAEQVPEYVAQSETAKV